jgi:hypothetical protein
MIHAVEIAAFVVSLAAIGFALVSLVLSIRTDRRQARAEQRAERQETREEAEARQRRSGRPIVIPRGGGGGPGAPRIQHDYMVKNGGQATIGELFLWVEDGEENVVSTRAGGRVGIGPGETGAAMAVEVFQQPVRERLYLMVEWTDAEGTHEEYTGIDPPRHH